MANTPAADRIADNNLGPAKSRPGLRTTAVLKEDKSGKTPDNNKTAMLITATGNCNHAHKGG